MTARTVRRTKTDGRGFEQRVDGRALPSRRVKIPREQGLPAAKAAESKSR